jgi:hypothetical protein
MTGGPLPNPAPSSDDRQVIFCIYCGKPQEIGKKALSVTCKFCHKLLRIEDTRIKDYTAKRTIETVGMVTVEKKGNVVVPDITCGGLIVRGKVKGNVVSYGPVLVSPEAEIRGDITAPTLAVGAGAILEGRYDIRPSNGKPGAGNA